MVTVADNALVPIREVARRLRMSLDEVMFLIEERRLAGYWVHQPSILMARVHGEPDPLPQAIKLVLPIWCYQEEVRDASAVSSPSPRKTINRQSLLFLEKEVASLENALLHQKKSESDALDYVIRLAVESLNQDGGKWTYVELLRRISRLAKSDDTVDELIKAVDVTKGVIYWQEGKWRKPATQRGTIQNRLRDISPKKSRLRQK